MAVVPIADAPAHAEQARDWCAKLESGDILFFPQTPVALPPQDIEFLLSLQQTNSSLHKNIAYKPHADSISGIDTSNADQQQSSGCRPSCAATRRK